MIARKVIAVANQRSGVGATATVLSIGRALSERGHRVLMVDLDPQASLTAVCGVEHTASVSMGEVLGGTLPGKISLREILREIAPGRGLLLAPSDPALAYTEMGLLSRLGRDLVMQRALDQVRAQFDVILIDCPPSIGMLTLSALQAADGVLIPAKPEVNDLRALWIFLASLEKIKQELNTRLDVIGVMITSFNYRLEHHKAVLASMRAAGLDMIPGSIWDQVELIRQGPLESAVYVPGSPEAQAELALSMEEWLRRGPLRRGRGTKPLMIRPGTASLENVVLDGKDRDDKDREEEVKDD